MLRPESERDWPEGYARSFTPLRRELEKALRLAIPRRGRSPLVAFLKVTDFCQKNCVYCDANIPRGKELKTEEVFRVLNNLAEAGIKVVDLSGGEPTLRKDLAQIISHSNELGMLTTMTTNGGEGLDYAYWHNLAEAGLFGASFSYDGVGEKADPRVTHLASFLVNQLHIYGGIKTVAWEENLDKVYGVARKCMLNNIFFQAVPAVALGGETSASAEDFTPLDYQGRKELVKILTDPVLQRQRLFANFLRIPKKYLKEVVDNPNPNSWHCQHPSSHWVSVDAQGRARICTDRPLSKTYLLAGEENPLLTEAFHQDVERGSKECGGCSWLCHWDGNRGLRRGLDYLRLVLTIAGYT